MKWLGLIGSILVLAGAFAAVSRQEAEWHLLVGGGIEGYLSPCGCTEPMQGGIRRKVQAYLTLSPKSRTTRVELGPLSSGIGRQDEMKIEAAVEALAAGDVSAISSSYEDWKFGSAMAANLSRMSKDRLVNTGAPGENHRATLAHGPFLIGSWDPRSSQSAAILGSQALSEEEAVSGLTQEAELRGLRPVLLLEDGRDSAQRLAQAHPSLAVIVYRSKSNPPLKAALAGRTYLVTPGPQGKSVVRLSFRDAELVGQKVVSLGPEIKNHPDAQRIFLTYKQRVKDEGLLDLLPRSEGEEFAGTKKCLSCHQQEGKVWKASEHSHALKTLEADGSDRDPDCVSCHVVGLDKKQGFRARTSTPHLTDVGCESCHGPGARHATAPSKVKMGATLKSCTTCHNSDHSPYFDEAAYWKKIAH